MSEKKRSMSKADRERAFIKEWMRRFPRSPFPKDRAGKIDLLAMGVDLGYADVADRIEAERYAERTIFVDIVAEGAPVGNCTMRVQDVSVDDAGITIVRCAPTTGLIVKKEEWAVCLPQAVVDDILRAQKGGRG